MVDSMLGDSDSVAKKGIVEGFYLAVRFGYVRWRFFKRGSKGTNFLRRMALSRLRITPRK